MSDFLNLYPSLHYRKIISIMRVLFSPHIRKWEKLRGIFEFTDFTKTLLALLLLSLSEPLIEFGGYESAKISTLLKPVGIDLTILAARFSNVSGMEKMVQIDNKDYVKWIWRSLDIWIVHYKDLFEQLTFVGFPQTCIGIAKTEGIGDNVNSRSFSKLMVITCRNDIDISFARMSLLTSASFDLFRMVVFVVVVNNFVLAPFMCVVETFFLCLVVLKKEDLLSKWINVFFFQLLLTVVTNSSDMLICEGRHGL